MRIAQPPDHENHLAQLVQEHFPAAFEAGTAPEEPSPHPMWKTPAAPFASAGGLVWRVVWRRHGGGPRPRAGEQAATTSLCYHGGTGVVWGAGSAVGWQTRVVVGGYPEEDRAADRAGTALLPPEAPGPALWERG